MVIEWLKGLLIVAVIFVPLERILTLHREQKIFRRGWLNDLVYLTVNGQVINFALILIVAGIVFLSRWAMPASVKDAVAAQPFLLQLVEVIVLADLGFYFMHRLFHAVPWMWKFHAIHHSIEELDWLAGARVHPIDQILTKSASFLPVFALGFSDAAIGTYLVIYGWQAFLVHSNVALPLGPLRWLAASPEFHHWHHSKDPAARDKNFAGQLPVIDVIFGTDYMPKGKTPESYGVDEPVPTRYVAQLIYPFRTHGAPENEARTDASPPVAVLPADAK